MIASLEHLWLGNSLREWALALGLALSINLLVAGLRWFAMNHLARLAANTASKADDVAIAMAARTRQLLIFGVTLMIGTRYLNLPHHLDVTLIRIATVSGFLQLGLWLNGGLNFWLDSYRRQTRSGDAGAATSLAALGFVAKTLLWTFLVLIMLDNLGVNVTAMVAGLGVGGIAVALAVQNILGDLFASLSIVIDKPFVIGDTITVDAFTGTVEHVGLKTTRLRATGGEEIIVSNSDLLKTRIRNLKRMSERRITFMLSLVHQTPADRLTQVPALLREIVSGQDWVTFERAHFRAITANGLEFEVAYLVLTPDFVTSLDIQQRINLSLMQRLQAEGLVIATPAGTVRGALPHAS